MHIRIRSSGVDARKVLVFIDGAEVKWHRKIR